jgi:hypothetical protein
VPAKEWLTPRRPSLFIVGDEWRAIEWRIKRSLDRGYGYFDDLWNGLYKFGFMRMGELQELTPALPLSGVKLVLSYYERGTASELAYNWLNRTEADDDAVVAAICEWSEDVCDR